MGSTGKRVEREARTQRREQCPIAEVVDGNS